MSEMRQEDRIRTEEVPILHDGQKFLSAITRCQSLYRDPDLRIKFTTRHLFYELHRSSLGVIGKDVLVFFLALFVPLALLCTLLSWLFLGSTSAPFWLLLGAVGIWAVLPMALAIKRPQSTPIKPQLARKLGDNTFDQLLARWQSVHGVVKNMLPPYSESACASSEFPEGLDVLDYSFDRAVITDNAEIAAMLVANNFHFENNCAVLSVDGFPGPQAETIVTMLRRNAHLTVVAVHDASKSGIQLAQTLRQHHWFPDPSVNIIDVGLLPRHVRKIQAPAVKDATVSARPWTLDARLAAADDGQQPCAMGSATLYLQPEEQDWLDQGHIFELAAVRPARLMWALFNAFAWAPHAEEYENYDWNHDYGDYYAADHFG